MKNSRYLVLLLLLLLLVRNPICLQAEHNMLDRGAGTSFSSASVNRGDKQVQMQVCITIGCCHHVCRHFSGDSGSTGSSEHPELAPFLQHALPQQEGRDMDTSPLHEEETKNVELVSSMLEYSAQGVFSPAIKFLTILNTDNSSWIEILQATSTDEQFFVQALQDDSIVAPGESLTVAVVFLPRKIGVANAKIRFQTSVGALESQVTGEAVSNYYQIPSLQAIEAVRGKLIHRTITFHNPHGVKVQIKEVQIWPGDSYKKAVCLSAATKDRVTSCLANGFTPEMASFSERGSLVSLTKLKGSWVIQPQETVGVAELEVSSDAAKWDGHVYIKFSRNESEEVVLVPLRVWSEGGTCQKQASAPARKMEVKETQQSSAAVASGSWVQTNDLMALRVAESLLKELGHTLLRQRDIRKGGLAAGNNEPTFIAGQALSFQMVQTGARERMSIIIANPTHAPVLVNLILASEAKSRNCKYRGNWFWQGDKPQVHRENTVFAFDTDAVTEALVQGGSEITMGPVTFYTRQKCDWTSLLFIKNNVTGLEWIPIRGRGGSASLVFLNEGSPVQKLSMAVVTEANSTSKDEICNARVHRTFQIKNTGDLALEFRGMDLSAAPGVTLDSFDAFSLAAGETRDMVISYAHDYHAAATKQVLKLATSIGTIQTAVVATVPRELISLCGNDSMFQQRVALPVSVCALVLVLGVFSRLLLQELSPQTAVAKTRLFNENNLWKHAWKTIGSARRSLWTARTKVKVFVADNNARDVKHESNDLKPVATRKKPGPPEEKLQPKKKKKSRSPSSSSPRSQSSSSGPASPHSGSDSEVKLPAIDRILNSSRFSGAAAAIRKARSRNSTPRKTDKEGAWEPPLPKAATRSEVRAAESKRAPTTDESPKARRATKCDTPPAVDGIGNDVRSLSQVQTPDATETPAAASISSKHDLKISPPPTCDLPASQPRSPKITRKDEGISTPTKQLTSIGQLRRAAIERSSADEKIHHLPDADSVYDIWGDHFAEISSTFSTPTGTPNTHLAPQSFFSQSLPPSGHANAEEHLLSSQDLASLLSFLPAVETYTGIPEPPPSHFEWNGESIYTAIVS